MKTRKIIWKVAIDIKVSVPEHAEILTMQIQKGVPYIWLLVDPDNDYENRLFFIVGTGHLHDNLSKKNYIGTYQELNGQFIWHVFEDKDIK